jgi:PAP2 superfamily C-terminal
MKSTMRWIVLLILFGALVALCWLLALAGKAEAGSMLAEPWVRYGGRIALVAAALGAWFITQQLIGSRAPLAEGMIGDLVHDLTAPVNRWLHAHPRAANRLLMGSSFGIDVFGLALIGSGLIGETLRPFMALLLLFFFRQVCQACCALPAPPGIIWRHPGAPTLLVTYGVANDFFISGHTAIAVLGALWAAAVLPWWAAVIAGVMALGEAITVLILRAHYTMDVLAAITAAWCAWALAGYICVGF